MAEEETNSRIEELKARLEADPGSRVFYQLGEELRKADRGEEAEQVLRNGLEKHPAYLSAWISLGRVLKGGSRPEEAIECLNRAFALDPQNVVAARLLGEAYTEIGDNVEAIKKYKLVAALHPADEDVQERIDDLERKLEAEGKLESPGETPAPPPPPPAEEPAEPEAPPSEAAPEPPAAEAEPAPEPSEEEAEAPPEPEETEIVMGGESEPSIDDETPQAAEPAASAVPLEGPEESDESHGLSEEGPAPGPPPDEGPFFDAGAESDEGEVSSGGDSADIAAEGPPALEMEMPAGPEVEQPGEIEMEMPAGPEMEQPGEIEMEMPAASEPEQPGEIEMEMPATPEDHGEQEDVVATITMGDLYARQGHVERAREIYRQVLAGEPDHSVAKERLASLEADEEQSADVAEPSGTPQQMKIRRLEEWLSKVNRG